MFREKPDGGRALVLPNGEHGRSIPASFRRAGSQLPATVRPTGTKKSPGLGVGASLDERKARGAGGLEGPSVRHLNAHRADTFPFTDSSSRRTFRTTIRSQPDGPVKKFELLKAFGTTLKESGGGSPDRS
jgi:hypothetical protein